MIIMVILFLGVEFIQAQEFLSPFAAVSKKKDAYITLTDGTEITGTVDKIKRKKGLFETIVIKEGAEKKSLASIEISSMYLPATAFGKLNKALESTFDASSWDNMDINSEHISNGYAYYESSEVQLKKEKVTVLMQLLNPGFSSKIKVFFDPWAAETASTSVGGFKVAGGDAKSYYIKKGETVGYKFRKKDYKKEFEGLFGDCEAVNSQFKEDMRWGDFPKAVSAYADCN